MSQTDELSTGELGRRMDALGASMTNGFNELSRKVEDRPDWNDVKRVEKGLLDKIEALTLRVAKSESWGTWGGRLVLGGLALAALSTLVPKL